MYIVIWEYQVKSEKQAEFEQVYRANGEWVELFKKGDGYLGTELLRDHDQPQRYLTLDRWDSGAAYEHFLKQWAEEYKSLDARCKGLTESEALVGKWHSA